MPLQIRRGPTADRVAFTPVEGELIYDTQSKSLYIGDGTTTGGIAAAGLTAADVRDSVGSLFSTGTHDYITFTYDSESESISTVVDLTLYDGTIQAAGFKGTVYGDDSTTLINATNSSINLDGTVKGDIVPDTDEAYDLGSSSAKFKDLYLSGSSIYLGSANITATGTTVNLPVGSTVGGVPLGGGDGVVEGSTYKINIAADDSTILVNSDTQTFTGYLVGDVTGSLFGDDSTVLVDGVNNLLKGRLLTDRVEVTASGSEADPALTIAELTSTLVSLETRTGAQLQLFTDALYVGTASTNSELRVYSVGVENTATAVMTSYNDSTSSNYLTFVKSRGTVGTPSAVQADDKLYSILWNAFDGTNYTSTSAIIDAVVDGTVGTGIVPGQLNFKTANSSGTITTALQINSSQTVTVTSGAFETNNVGITLKSAGNTANAKTLALYRVRNTLESPTAVQADDQLYTFSFQGHDGTTNIGAAQIRAEVKTGSTVSTGIVPGQMKLRTANATGTMDNRIIIDDETVRVNPLLNAVGGITSLNYIKFPVYADTSARDTALASPEAGMVVFITTGTKLQVNTDGTTGGWVDLN